MGVTGGAMDEESRNGEWRRLEMRFQGNVSFLISSWRKCTEKGKKKIGEETLVSGCGQDILDSGESPLLSLEYPIFYFSNTLDKACLSFSQTLI